MIYNTAKYNSFIAKDIAGNEFKVTYYNEDTTAKTTKEFVEEMMGLASVARVMFNADVFTRAISCDEEALNEIKKGLKKVKFRTFADRIDDNTYGFTIVYNDKINC